MGINESLLHSKEVKLQSAADISLREYWFNYTFLTWEWWLLVFLLLVPWVIWLKIVDCKRIFEILTFGFMVMVVSLVLDTAGVEFDLWDYRHQFVPFFDVLIVYDFSVMPVVYMVAYEYFNDWKKFVVVFIIIAAIFAFVAEPLLVELTLYQLFKWEYYYSFPIYIGIAVILKGVMAAFKRKMSKS